jgi:hypothetical protein
MKISKFKNSSFVYTTETMKTHQSCQTKQPCDAPQFEVAHGVSDQYLRRFFSSVKTNRIDFDYEFRHIIQKGARNFTNLPT